MGNEWPHAAEKDSQSVVPLIEMSACDGSVSSKISQLQVSESEHLNVINLAKTTQILQLLDMTQVVLSILSEAVLGLSQVGDLQ